LPAEAQAVAGSPMEAPPRERWSSRAFGMSLTGAFETLAFDSNGEPADDSPVELEIVSGGELDRAWTPSDPVRRGTAALDDGTVFITIDADAELGYRMWAKEVGRYMIAPSGDRVACAPDDLSAWDWQRFLIGQVLPLVAALRGYELLHASAVCFGEHAVAFLGDTGAGKTSLATNMLLEGADFVADDALALEARDGHVIAHPGPPIAAVRHAEVDRLSAASRQRLGEAVGSNPKEVLFRVSRRAGAVPLRAMYFIDRTSTDSGVRFEQVTSPLLLLGSTFNFVHRPPDRLANLLDICARIDATVGAFKVISSSQIGARSLAQEIRRHVETDV
jgi:hypothetical protein